MLPTLCPILLPIGNVFHGARLMKSLLHCGRNNRLNWRQTGASFCGSSADRVCINKRVRCRPQCAPYWCNAGLENVLGGDITEMYTS